MQKHDIITIGASAGGVEALRGIVSVLPRTLDASIFIVLHTPQDGSGMLAALLSRAGPLSATNPGDGEAIQRQHIYVAPPARHMLVENGHIHLITGPNHNRHRPAIDPLFMSAARVYGPRVMGIVLTGYLDDGTAGLAAIKRHGGLTLVQDPEDAFVPDMPRNALENVEVDHCVALAEIPGLILRMTKANSSIQEIKPMDPENPSTHNPFGKKKDLSPYTCPECHGTLWERAADPSIFQCRVGHSYTAESLFADQNDLLERAMWAALKSLQENSDLARRMGERAAAKGHLLAAERFIKKAEVSDSNASVLRDLLNSAASRGNYVLDNPEDIETRAG